LTTKEKPPDYQIIERTKQNVTRPIANIETSPGRG
jgi:hypothetical protein